MSFGQLEHWRMWDKCDCGIAEALVGEQTAVSKTLMKAKLPREDE
jgi:hypothetical protein